MSQKKIFRGHLISRIGGPFAKFAISDIKVGANLIIIAWDRDMRQYEILVLIFLFHFIYLFYEKHAENIIKPTEKSKLSGRMFCRKHHSVTHFKVIVLLMTNAFMS